MAENPFRKGRRLDRLVAATALLLFSGVSAIASAAPLSKGPYLQSLGQTGVTVKVELSAPDPASLEVYAAGTAHRVAQVTSPDVKTFHVLRAEGLEPGASFDYRVESGETKSELGHFTTAPTGAPPFRFVIYGDARSDVVAHAAVVRGILSAPADFLVNTGDMVLAGKDPSDWAAFFTIEGLLLRDRCVFACVGNHELSRGDPAGQVAFLRYFAAEGEHGERNRLYGSFRWSNTRFFLLNAMDAWTGEERDWLRDELDRAAFEPGLVHRIAVLHHGPFSSGPHGGNAALASAGITNIMQSGKIDLVVAGHDHVYERGEGGGIKYVISGGSGAPLYEHKLSAKETITFESVHHFIEATIDGPSIKLLARRVNGSVIEACGFRGAGPWECDVAPPSGPVAAAAPPGGKAEGRSGGTPGRGTCNCSLPGHNATSTPPLLGLIGLFALLTMRLCTTVRKGHRDSTKPPCTTARHMRGCNLPRMRASSSHAE